MIIDFKMLKRFLIAGILIGVQGCASVNLNPFSEKPYFASPPAQTTRADKEIFDRALFRQTNNRIQPAIKVWKEFLEKHPRSFEAHNNLGLVYFEDDQVDAAIGELETAMSLEPSESKIKDNLIRVLKFKSTLYKEARDYNSAVDTLKRVQKIASPEEKEKIGFRIEQYEDQAFEQAKRINTLEAYEGFLRRYPDGSKNSDEARMKVEGLKRRDTVSLETPDSPEALAMSPLAKGNGEDTNGESPMLEGSLMESGDKKDMEKGTSMMKEIIEKKMEEPAAIGEKLPVEAESGGQAMEKAGRVQPVAPAIEGLDKGFIPVQPLEVPRSDEQKIEIASQPEPKPATGADLFPSPIIEASPPAPPVAVPALEDFPEVAKAPQKKVKIVTRKDPLRVREDPTLDSPVLATIAKGSMVPLINEENGWYKIEFSTGEMGWISKKYARLVE